jgi:flagellar biosynthetic protein FlhB
MADSSKTEKATPKRREEQRKKGNIFQSSDVVSAISILALFFALKILFPYAYKYMSGFFRKYSDFALTVQTLSAGIAMDVLKDCIIALLLLAGPIMLVAIAAGVIASGVQTGFKFSKELIKFNFSKLSMIQGFKRMFSLRSVTELIKAIIKVSILAYILYNQISKLMGYFPQMMYQDVMQATSFILNSIMDIVIQISVAFIAIAALDYLYQWWQYEQDIKMTKQEVKDEYKELEGDPQIKGAIRERQRRMAQQRMMENVPTADVIVRNPTHFAVALKYDIDKNSAPVVVAKGQDYVALKIIEIAEQYHVPMTENKPLARALYASVKVGREIPPEYYVALAEIMAWVYSLKKEDKKY